MRARRLVAAAAAVVATLVLGGCNDTPSTGDQGYVDGDGIVTRLAADERKSLAGPVEGETLEGEPITLDDFAGKVTVVNVWYAACPPCRKEAPILVETAKQLEGEVAFVGINTRDADPSQAIAFERTFDVPYPTIFDPSGRSLLSFSGTLPPSAVPSTVILDEQGRVAASIVGAVSSARTLQGLIEDVRDGAPA